MNNLFDKIKKIEALIEGAKTEGEKIAALLAKERISGKIIENRELEKSEYSLYCQDNWHKKLLLAICRKYGVEPYRYKRQKYTTVMVNVNENFLNDKLWPEYLEYSKHLELLVEELTDSIIRKIHDGEDESVIHGQIK